MFKNKKLTYDISMAVLSLVVIVMLIIDSSYTMPYKVTNIFEIIDNIILIIFAVDYFTRLILSKNKKVFVRNNIIDLFTIIPFGSVFQVAKVLKLTRLLKLTKLFKALKVLKSVAYLLRIRKHIDDFLKTNNFNYVIWFTLATLFIGTLGIHFTEGISYGNALWWSFVTLTTVGYGDISPSTLVGRITASILMLVGIGALGMLTGTIATYFLSRNNNTSYKYQTIEDIKTKLDNFDELSIDDIDDIYKVLKALK